MTRVLKPLAVAGALLVPVAVATLFAARGADAQGASSVGNPALLKELQALRAQVTALESSVSGQLSSLQSSVDDQKTKRFYLTQGSFGTLDATGACAAGFHMASMWEIHDPSNLKYDTELGFVEADSGSGPPANRQGWIRTGRGATTGSGPAGFNCNAWTSTDGEGTVARIDWLETTTYPWDAFDDGCNQQNRVWCVQD